MSASAIHTHCLQICGSGSPWAGLWRVTGTSVTQKLVDVVAINGVTITNDTSVVHAPQCAGELQLALSLHPSTAKILMR